MDTTPWYKNKSTLSHIVAFLLGAYALASQHLAPGFNLHVPAVPAWILTILSAVGVYDNHAE